MFTGLIETLGTLRSVQPGDRSALLEVRPDQPLEVRLGDSVAVNGVCLTVEREPAARAESFVLRAVAETLARTTLGTLTPGARLNLERALPASGRFDGHLVAGHVDGTGVLRSVRPDGDSIRLTVSAPRELHRYLAQKGSICLDGISLTIAQLDAEGFSVAVIPHTLQATTLRDRRPGDRLNLEVDLLARYCERLLSFRDAPKDDTALLSLLERNGF